VGDTIDGRWPEAVFEVIGGDSVEEAFFFASDDAHAGTAGSCAVLAAVKVGIGAQAEVAVYGDEATLWETVGGGVYRRRKDTWKFADGGISAFVVVNTREKSWSGYTPATSVFLESIPNPTFHLCILFRSFF